MMARPVPKRVKTIPRRMHHQKRSRVAPSFSRNNRAKENIITTTAIQKARFSSPWMSGFSTASWTRGIRLPATITRFVSASAFATVLPLPGTGVGVGACAITAGAQERKDKTTKSRTSRTRGWIDLFSFTLILSSWFIRRSLIVVTGFIGVTSITTGLRQFFAQFLGRGGNPSPGAIHTADRAPEVNALHLDLIDGFSSLGFEVKEPCGFGLGLGALFFQLR